MKCCRRCRTCKAVLRCGSCKAFRRDVVIFDIFFGDSKGCIFHSKSGSENNIFSAEEGFGCAEDEIGCVFREKRSEKTTNFSKNMAYSKIMLFTAIKYSGKSNKQLSQDQDKLPAAELKLREREIAHAACE